MSLEVLQNRGDVALGNMVSGWVGLGDLRGLFQPGGFCDTPPKSAAGRTSFLFEQNPYA